jgi:DNA-binding XRE family transcriptional regulator
MKHYNYKDLKDVRTKFKLKQSDVAKSVGISESYYNMIENGNRVPPVDTAALIARTLHLSLDDFFMLYNFTKCKDCV